ncbi:DUF6520 family protein [Flavobacterium psychrotrophum]|uniref:DUF6520 family protein n=1 Tax=Flavobacterium psychrotrophum TaxID=2294119 RepID=UPI000E31D52B|nr:DUF6520 family protein [Flavobacterium psychrotrophum]
MKTLILRKGLPVGAFLIAITAAFAFKPAPKTDVTNYFGAVKVGATACEITDIECSDVNNGIPCRNEDNVDLYRMLSATSCPSQLWRP